MGIVKLFVNYHIIAAAIKPLKWEIVDMRKDDFQASCPYCYSTNFVLLNDPIFYCVYCGKRVKSNNPLIRDKEPKKAFIDEDSFNSPDWVVIDYDQHRMFTTLMCTGCGEKSVKMTPYSRWEYCGKCGIKISNPEESEVGVSKQIKDISEKKQSIKLLTKQRKDY